MLFLLILPDLCKIVKKPLKIYDFYEKIGYKSTDGKGKNSIGIYLGLKENGVKVYRTDTDGEISIVVNRKGEIVNIQKFIK